MKSSPSYSSSPKGRSAPPTPEPPVTAPVLPTLPRAEQLGSESSLDLSDWGLDDSNYTSYLPRGEDDSVDIFRYLNLGMVESSPAFLWNACADTPIIERSDHAKNSFPPRQTAQFNPSPNGAHILIKPYNPKRKRVDDYPESEPSKRKKTADLLTPQQQKVTHVVTLPRSASPNRDAVWWPSGPPRRQAAIAADDALRQYRTELVPHSGPSDARSYQPASRAGKRQRIDDNGPSFRQAGPESLRNKRPKICTKETQRPQERHEKRCLMCSVCIRSFSRESDLYRHLTTTKQHKDHADYFCSFPGCNVTFSRKDAFQRHWNNCHG
ncbi:hypothetical protein BU17DRAFT_65329 [Hysterangium stoloniferum]|nr:hypothetical protein BU17DRAFT_65329 [Hysterangium stoloniferum]